LFGVGSYAELKGFVMKRSRSVLGAFCMILMAACASEADSASDQAEVRAKEGATKLVDGSPVTTDVAVGSKYVYVANGYRGVILLEPGTMKKKGTFSKDSSGEQLRADEVQIVGDSLMVTSVWNEAGDPWGHQSITALIIKFVGLGDAELKRTITLDLANATRAPGSTSSFGDMPNLSVFCDGKEIIIGYSHMHIASRFLRFAVPSAAKTSFDIMDPPSNVKVDVLDDRAMHYATMTKDEIITAEAGPRSNGISHGKLVVLDRKTLRVKGEVKDVGYPVEVIARDGKYYIADHEQRIVIADAATFKVEKTVNTGGWVDGIDVTEGQVLASTREGVFVTKR
jgi:DNA-binding beta-propeller fold protein YncE